MIMSQSSRIALAGLLSQAFSCFGQTAQSPATADELKYFRFLLMQFGGIDHHPSAKAAFERNVTLQLGLNNQEVAVLRAAGQELQVLLLQSRPTVRSIRPDPTGRLSPADRATLAALNVQRDQKIELLANRILNQVRPQTAVQLRLPGRILANRGNPASSHR